MNGNDGLVHAKDVVQQLISELNPSQAVLTFTLLCTNWEDLVGNDIALHVTPENLINDTLILESDHPGWTQKMKLIENELISKINIRFPELEISKVRMYYSSGDET